MEICAGMPAEGRYVQAFVRKIIGFLSIDVSNPALLIAQYRAFSRQMPLMYFLLLTSSWALAIPHAGAAPFWLTVLVPLGLSGVAAWRVLTWWRSRRIVPTPEEAIRTLRRTNRLAVIIAIAFTSWSLALFPYGNAFAQTHVAFYMAITVIACIFSLMYVRSAALWVTLIVNGSIIAFFAATTQPHFVAIAVNVVLVSIGLMTMLNINYANFARMVEAQQRTEALNGENLRLANLDSLTELPNRRAFFARLETALAAARQSGGTLALGIVDLDGFKPVNDVYGHSAGDRLLVQVSQRLAGLEAQDIFIARLGGDEFAFLLPEISSDAEALLFGDTLAEMLSAPFPLPEATVKISASIGVATAHGSQIEASALFDRADYALYQGKAEKRGQATLFSSSHDAQIHRDARIEQALRSAYLETELSVLFQPIVDIERGAISSFEALARWQSPVLGAVSPGEFIPVAERAGIVGLLTGVLLRKSLTALAYWPADIRLSFNLSAHDLNSAEGVWAILDIIRTSQIDARRLELEITETSVTHDFTQVHQSIELLRNHGCGISLDDFGTGYSSLSRLHGLPLTRIKVDRSFVSSIENRPSSYKIVKSLLVLSRDIGLDCVLEGVETEAELAVIRQLGGRLIQGYLFSPPVPLARTADLIEQFHPVGPIRAAASA